MTGETCTDRSLGVDCSSTPATCVAKNRSNPDQECEQTARNKKSGWDMAIPPLQFTIRRPLRSFALSEPTTMVRPHWETGKGSISDTPTRPCYPAMDVCDTIGHAIAGCAMAWRAWRRSFVGNKGEGCNMTNDRIEIKDLLVRGILGVNDWERTNKQDILINVALFADLKAAGESDDLEHTVNYRTVAKTIVDHVESSKRLTAEALAADLAKICLSHSGVDRVRVRVEKPGAVRFAGSVGVMIERSAGDFA